MHWYDFLWLIHELYTARYPDLIAIQRRGLLAVKIAQIYALRADFLAPETCKHLAALYRKTTAIPAAQLDQLIATDTPPAFMQAFSDFDRKPIASASIGQVHRATLRSGESVAVKLVKAQYTEQFRRDISAASGVFRVATALYPKLRGVANPVAILREIEKTTTAELDLRNEIQGHARLARIFDNHRSRFDLTRVRSLRTYPELTSERVLVTEWLSGPTLDELMERGELSYDQLLDFFSIQGFCMFAVGTFHGDIHPGNIVLQDKTFIFIDAGYIGVVSDGLRKHLFDFFDALSQWEYRACARHLNEMSSIQLAGRAYDQYEKKLVELYADFKNATVAQVSLTKKMMQTIRLGVLSGMQFEEGMFDIIKSLMYLDGMVLRVNPQAVLLKDMRRFIDDFRAVM